MPGDACVSLPIPVLRDGTLAASFFAAITVPRADGTNEDMFAPAVEITLDWATGRQLELRVLRPPGSTAEDAPAIPIRSHVFQGPLTAALEQELDAQMQRLDTLLDAAVRRYGALPQRPPMDDGTRYLEQFEDLVPLAARPYYTAISPDFFAWVEQGR